MPLEKQFLIGIQYHAVISDSCASEAGTDLQIHTFRRFFQKEDGKAAL